MLGVDKTTGVYLVHVGLLKVGVGKISWRRIRLGLLKVGVKKVRVTHFSIYLRLKGTVPSLLYNK